MTAPTWKRRREAVHDLAAPDGTRLATVRHGTIKGRPCWYVQEDHLTPYQDRETAQAAARQAVDARRVPEPGRPMNDPQDHQGSKPPSGYVHAGYVRLTRDVFIGDTIVGLAVHDDYKELWRLHDAAPALRGLEADRFQTLKDLLDAVAVAASPTDPATAAR